MTILKLTKVLHVIILNRMSSRYPSSDIYGQFPTVQGTVFQSYSVSLLVESVGVEPTIDHVAALPIAYNPISMAESRGLEPLPRKKRGTD